MMSYTESYTIIDRFVEDCMRYWKRLNGENYLELPGASTIQCVYADLCNLKRNPFEVCGEELNADALRIYKDEYVNRWWMYL